MNAISLPRTRRFPIRQLLLAVALATATLAFLGRGGGEHAAPAKATITLSEWSIGLDRSSVPAGGVTFAIRNAGQAIHQLAVVKTDLAADALARAPRPTEQPLRGEPQLIGTTAKVGGGASREVTFDLRAGRYVLLCLEPGHDQSGMHVALEATWP